MSNRFNDCPLAIVGLGLRLPGADSLDSYWDMLLSGRHAIAPLPESRLHRKRYHQPGPATPGKSYTELGGTVPDEDLRPDALGLCATDLRSADKAHLWFLHTALAALAHGGIDPDSLHGQRLGIFVGHARGSALIADITYAASVESLTATLPAQGLAAEQLAAVKRDIIHDTHDRYPPLQEDGGPFTAPHAAAGLLARRLKTTGPYMAVDAACASSFAALDIAARAIHAGEIEAAIVGGCSYNQWSSLVLFSQAQALSATGSFPFDERADGFISSDGYAAIIVEPLARARAHGRRVLAVVRGIGGSCDGRGKSLWAPLKEGQIEAIARAYHDDVTPQSVQVVEAHATGTAVGDATEISALAEIFGKDLEKADAPANKLPISSVKANVGHTRETAGLAGLIKIVLAMHKGIVPPAASFHTPSSRIDWSAVPFRVPRAAEPWPDRPAAPRRAAVNAFGIGGLNYHVVLDGEDAAHSLPTLTRATYIEDEPIAIVGAGVVMPGAAELHDFVRLLKDPPQLAQPDADRWEAELYFDAQGGPYRVAQNLGHFLSGWQFDWRKYKVPPKQVEHSDPIQFMMIDVVAQALRRCGYKIDAIPEHLRTAVYVGSIFGGDFTTRLNIGMRLPEFEEDLHAALHRAGFAAADIEPLIGGARPLLQERFSVEDQSGSFSSSTLASRVAKYFDFCGPCCAIDAEEASGLAALSASLTALRAGACDLALCCAAQRLLHHTRFAIYERLGRLAGPGRRGFYLTEGAVAFALRRLSDAQRDGQPILAVIKEVRGAASDTGAWSALRDAALLAKERLGTTFAPQRIECFATGVEKDEAEEREVLKQVYAPAVPQLISATAQLGMGQGASGLIGLLHLLGSSQPPSGSRDAVALNSIGFRGLAYHALLESGALLPGIAPQPSVAPVATIAAVDKPRLIRLGAPSAEALRKRITTADPEVLFAAAAGSGGFAESDSWRLAIVATSAAALRTKMTLAKEARDSSELWPALHEQGVFLHQRPTSPPELALAFSGQGSQYAGMLKELCAQHPETQAMRAEINQVLDEIGQPRFEDLVWNDALAERLGSDTWSTQIAVFCADMLMHSVLRPMNLSPSLLLAHSYGEYPALCAAGAWSLRTGILATFARCQVLGTLGEPPGKLVSTSASPEQISELVRRFADRGFVAPANFNSPDQTVLAVENAIIDAVIAALEADGAAAKLLPVPQPYHSRLLAPAQPGLETALASLPIRPPRIPFLSGVGNSYVADPQEIRRRLVDQLTAPLRFTELIKRAYADGVRVFIEVGPRTVLTRLIRGILKSEPVMALCTDHPKVSAGEQLARVQALLETQDLWQQRAPRDQATAATSPPTTAQVSGPIPHFDATERRRNKLATRHPTPADDTEATPQAAESPAASPATAQLSEMERFLVNFVCEQTGYPAEVVGLDQDLEADLGIDSLKKAQMLGELRDHFRLQLPSSAAGGGLSLAKIVTLRDVSRLLPAPTHSEAAVSSSAPTPAAPTAAVAPPAAARVAPAADAELLRLQNFGGSRFDIGKQHGELFGADIERGMRRYRELLGSNVFELDLVKVVMANHQQYFDEDGLAELRGIADGSGLPYERVVAFNLGLEPEHGLFGCSQIAVRAAANGDDGLVHAANEDSPIALRLGNQLPRFVQVRRLAGRNACTIFSAPGQLGGINGLNAAGLVVSSTMLLDQPRDVSAIGALHPCLVLRILEWAGDVEQAIALVKSWRRVGAWSLLISHTPSDEIAYLEYDGERLAIERVNDVVCTSNHSRLLKAGEVPEHSQHRLTRMATLLTHKPLRVPEVQAMLRDRMDLGRGRLVNHRTMNTVCRVDNQLSFVYAAKQRRLFVTPGPERGDKADHFSELTLKKLWPAQRAGDQRMRRFILRTETETSATISEPPRPLRTLIVGEGAVATLIARALRDAGSEVHTVATADEALFASPAALPQRLIVLTALDGQPSFADPRSEVRQQFLQRHGHSAMTLAQRWIVALRKAEKLEGAELVALTAMGGDFGFGGARDIRPEGGALSGLLKALRREVPELFVKLIDTPIGEPAPLLSRYLLAELGNLDAVEVGYVRGKRQRVRMIPRELPNVSQTAPSRALTPDAAWLVTGGGRGITAAVARELARRFGARLHLLGSTPLEAIPPAWLELDEAGMKSLRYDTLAEARKQGRPPQEAWRDIERRIALHTTLAALQKDKLDFRYYAVDLADAAALERVLAQARAAGPPLRGILHGAGVEAACELSKKTAAGIAATLNSKVLGLQHLLALTADDPIASIVGFGSVSGRFGGLGQTDYSLASDLLAKLLAAHRRATGVRATTIAWPAWGEIGMAARPESRLALEAAGQQFMPVAEGIEHLMRELNADLPENEIVIIDRPAVLDADHTALAEEAQDAIEERAKRLAKAAILDGVVASRGDAWTAESRFDPQRDVFLIDHQFEGAPILPAVIGLEAMAEAALLDVAPHTPFCIEDASIAAGMRFYSPRALPSQVQVTQSGDRRSVKLFADSFAKGGALSEPARLHVSAQISRHIAEPPAYTPPPHDADWQLMRYLNGPLSDNPAEARRVYHGPALRTLQRLCGGRPGETAHEAFAELTAPPRTGLRPERPDAEWRLPAALLDGCLVACGAFARTRLGLLSLPGGFARLTVVALPVPEARCHLQLRLIAHKEQERQLHFDFVLTDDHNRPILWANGYRAIALAASSEAGV